MVVDVKLNEFFKMENLIVGVAVTGITLLLCMALYGLSKSFIGAPKSFLIGAIRCTLILVFILFVGYAFNNRKDLKYLIKRKLRMNKPKPGQEIRI